MSRYDIHTLQAEIEASGRSVEEELDPTFRSTVDEDRLESTWNILQPPDVTSHRGWIGKPIVAVKRLSLAILRPHDHALLRRQAEFNAAVRAEIAGLHETIALLRREVNALKSQCNPAQ